MRYKSNIHNGSVPGKVKIHTWKEKKKVSLDNNSTLYCSTAHNGFFVQLVVLLQHPVMREQSNSSDIFTDQTENNNQ